MKKIDCHCHVRRWQVNNVDYREAAKEYRKENDLDAINVLSLIISGKEYLKPAIWQNILAAIQKLEDDKVYAQGVLLYPAENWDKDQLPHELKKQAEELMEIGFDGIKMLESKTSVYKKLIGRVDSVFYDEFFSYMEKEQIPLLWHVSDPEEFWDETRLSDNAKKNGWFYGDGTFPAREQIFKEVYNVLHKYPRLNVIFAHCFFKYDCPEEIKRLFDTYKNVRIDLAPCPEMFRDFTIKRDVWKGIFTQYKDRILFGTDVDNNLNPETAKRLVQDISRFLITDDEFVGYEYYGSEYTFPLKGLELDENVCSRIFGENFLDMMGQTPRKINKEALKRYIERYKEEIPEGEMKEMILKFPLDS